MEFLGGHGIAFDSVDVQDGVDGTRRWREAGSPPVPALQVDGVVTPVYHVSQLASALALDLPRELRADRLAWDLAALLDGWVEAVERLAPARFAEPTPARGRSLANLTVNVFRPVELLPQALGGGRFDWDPDGDAEVQGRLGDRVVSWAAGVACEWRAKALEEVDPDRRIETLRGPLSVAELLESQRWHAAFHYRQLVAVLGLPQGPLAGLRDLQLPGDVF